MRGELALLLLLWRQEPLCSDTDANHPRAESIDFVGLLFSLMSSVKGSFIVSAGFITQQVLNGSSAFTRRRESRRL